jgi:hypothetical protein
MLSTTTRKSTTLSDTQQVARNTGAVVTQKIWLPKLLYDALPYFYLASGILAFLATLYISEWFWVLPHYLIFCATCLHLGVVIYRRRHQPPLNDDRELQS